MSVQFKDNKVLFHGDQVSFCVDHCTCIVDPPPPPPPTPIRFCTDCRGEPCENACAPTKLVLGISGATVVSPRSTEDGLTVTTTGTVPATLTLIQTTPCLWSGLLESSGLTVTLSGTATGSSTTVEAQANLSGGVLNVHVFVRIGILVFTLFNGRKAVGNWNLSITDDVVDYSVKVTTLSGNDNDDHTEIGYYQLTDVLDPIPGEVATYFGEDQVVTGVTLDPVARFFVAAPFAAPTEGGEPITFTPQPMDSTAGGRIASGGTVVTTPCDNPPCFCSNADTCLRLYGIAFPSDPDWIANPLSNNTYIDLPKTDVCEWKITTPAAAFGVSNLLFKVKWYNEGDTQAEIGCGFYLYVYATTDTDPVLKGVWYHAGTTPFGTYFLFDAYVAGLPQLVHVATCTTVIDPPPPPPPPPDDPVPTDCPAELPSAIIVGGWAELCSELTPIENDNPIWDGVLYRDPDYPATCRWGTLDPSVVTFKLPDGKDLLLAYVSLESGPARWELRIDIGLSAEWIGSKDSGTTPAGTYTKTGGSCDGPATLTVA